MRLLLLKKVNHNLSREEIDDIISYLDTGLVECVFYVAIICHAIFLWLCTIVYDFCNK